MTKSNLFVIAASLVLCCQLTCQSVAAEVVLDEDFEDGVADGFVTVMGSFSIGGGLRGSLNGYNANSITHDVVLLPQPFSTGTISVDIRIGDAAAGDFEIWFCATGIGTGPFGGEYPQYGYCVEVNPAGSDNPNAYLWRATNDTVAPLASQPNTITGGATHNVAVTRTADGHISVFLDGSPFMEATDSSFSSGGVALRFYRSGTIDNVRIEAEEEPLPAARSVAVAAVFVVVGIVIVGLRERQLLC